MRHRYDSAGEAVGGRNCTGQDPEFFAESYSPAREPHRTEGHGTKVASRLRQDKYTVYIYPGLTPPDRVSAMMARGGLTTTTIIHCQQGACSREIGACSSSGRVAEATVREGFRGRVRCRRFQLGGSGNVGNTYIAPARFSQRAARSLLHCVALMVIISSAPLCLSQEVAPQSDGKPSMLYDVCSGDADFGMWGRARVSPKTIDDALGTGGWRIKIIGGRLYINTAKFLPVQRLPGKRDFHSFLGLLRLTQKYGAELPDVEFVIQHNDMPKVNVAGRNPPTYVKKVLKKGKVRDAATKNPPLVFSTYVSVGQKKAWDIPWPQVPTRCCLTQAVVPRCCA